MSWNKDLPHFLMQSLSLLLLKNKEVGSIIREITAFDTWIQKQQQISNCYMASNLFFTVTEVYYVKRSTYTQSPKQFL